LTLPAVSAFSALVDRLGLESFARDEDGLKKRLMRRGVIVGALFGLLLRDGKGGDDGGTSEAAVWLLKM